MRRMGTTREEVLYYPAWFGVKGGLNNTIIINPNSSVKEINTSACKGVINILLALKFDCWMKII